MSKLISQLETAFEQSQQLLLLAQEEKWQELEERQKAHTLLITQIVTADISGDNPEEIRDWVNKIQATDRQTTALAEQLRQQTIQEQQQQNKAAKMQKALDSFK